MCPPSAEGRTAAALADAPTCAAYTADGAVVLRGLLSADEVELLRRGIDENLAHPSPRTIVVSPPNAPGLDGLELTVATSSCRDPAGPWCIAWGSLDLDIRVDPEFVGIEPPCGSAPSWLPLATQPRAWARCL
jgi:hypothetical protein